jgi:hypothetical protein
MTVAEEYCWAMTHATGAVVAAAEQFPGVLEEFGIPIQL